MNYHSVMALWNSLLSGREILQDRDIGGIAIITLYNLYPQM